MSPHREGCFRADLGYTANKNDHFSREEFDYGSQSSGRGSAEVPTDDFQALEDKVYRTIEMYKAAREAKTAAERDVQRLKQQLRDREKETESLRREAVQLRKDREEVRRRVEKMMRQIDAAGEEQVAS